MEFCFTVVKQGLDISGHKIDLRFHKFIYLGFLKFHVASKIGKETHLEFEIARFGAVISGSPLWCSKHTWGSVAVIGSLWAPVGCQSSSFLGLGLWFPGRGR